MIYHIDNSGRIVAVLAGQTAEQEAEALAAGLRVIEATGQYDREAHVYVDGAFAPIPDPTPAEALATARLAAKERLRAEFNRFIESRPDGAARYDISRKLNILAAMAQAAMTGAAPPPAAVSFQAWFAAAQAGYFAQKAAIDGAADLEALAAVAVDYQHFEAAHGLAGDVAADPGVTTSDLALI